MAFILSRTSDTPDTRSFSMVFAISTVSVVLPSVRTIFALILPAASVVASILLKSSTLTVTPVIPAFVSTFSTVLWISSFDVSLETIIFSNASWIAFFAAATFSSSSVSGVSFSPEVIPSGSVPAPVPCPIPVRSLLTVSVF